MDYRESLAYIASLAPRGWRLGLDRMREFAHRAGLDDAIGDSGDPRFIHIAGTNGKGSVTAYVASILHESGYRVGSYFSPYVYDPRERIQLGRELIPEKIFAGLTAMLQPLAEEFTETEYGGISEFEFKTAMALLFYKRLKCEWVALEVGLGGRLDATNIVQPKCSVICSIALDHTEILGPTLGEIAREKAGIIKTGVPVVVGAVPEEAFIEISAAAEAQNSPLWLLGRDFSLESDEVGHNTVKTPLGVHTGLFPGIKGAAQAENMALAVAAVDAAGATRTLSGMVNGVQNASIPGRFEERRIGGKALVLDGAHNGEASAVLSNSLATFYGGRKARLVIGMVQGHAMTSFIQPIRAHVAAAYAVPIDFHRTRMPEEIANETRALGIPTLEFESASAGFEAALADCTPDEFVLVTGSFYLLGEIDRTLKSR